MHIDTITSRKLIGTIKYQGSKVISSNMVLLYYPSEDEGKIKYLVTASKKLGNAVIRNKLKRKIRALVRQNADQMSQFYCYFIICRKNMLSISFENLHHDFLRLIKKIGAK